MKITLLASGKLRGAEAEIAGEYTKRLKTIKVIDIIAPATPNQQKIETELFLSHTPENAFCVVCDETGKNITSRDFAKKMQSWQNLGKEIIFIIGGADGTSEIIKKRADYMLGFGSLTWPHRFARLMLLEQIYRAQQIHIGHPYHRD